MKDGKTVTVEAYSGYRVNERPAVVIMGGRRLVIRRLLSQRRTPDHDEFTVELEDGRVCKITWNAYEDRWSMG